MKYCRYGFSVISATRSLSENPNFFWIRSEPNAILSGFAGIPVLLGKSSAYLSSISFHFLHPSVFRVKFHPHRLVKICDTILAVSVFLIHDSLLSNARFFHLFMHFSCTYSIPHITSEVSIFNGFRWLYWCLKQSLKLGQSVTKKLNHNTNSLNILNKKYILCISLITVYNMDKIYRRDKTYYHLDYCRGNCSTFNPPNWN